MIGQYLPNNNETATVAFRQKFCQLNSLQAKNLFDLSPVVYAYVRSRYLLSSPGQVYACLRVLATLAPTSRKSYCVFGLIKSQRRKLLAPCRRRHLHVLSFKKTNALIYQVTSSPTKLHSC
jgi:hypothetical protein